MTKKLFETSAAIAIKNNARALENALAQSKLKKAAEDAKRRVENIKALLQIQNAQIADLQKQIDAKDELAQGLDRDKETLAEFKAHFANLAREFREAEKQKKMHTLVATVKAKTAKRVLEIQMAKLTQAEEKSDDAFSPKLLALKKKQATLLEEKQKEFKALKSRLLNKKNIAMRGATVTFYQTVLADYISAKIFQNIADPAFKMKLIGQLKKYGAHSIDWNGIEKANWSNLAAVPPKLKADLAQLIKTTVIEYAGDFSRADLIGALQTAEIPKNNADATFRTIFGFIDTDYFGHPRADKIIQLLQALQHPDYFNMTSETASVTDKNKIKDETSLVYFMTQSPAAIQHMGRLGEIERTMRGAEGVNIDDLANLDEEIQKYKAIQDAAEQARFQKIEAELFQNIQDQNELKQKREELEAAKKREADAENAKLAELKAFLNNVDTFFTAEGMLRLAGDENKLIDLLNQCVAYKLIDAAEKNSILKQMGELSLGTNKADEERLHALSQAIDVDNTRNDVTLQGRMQALQKQFDQSNPVDKFVKKGLRQIEQPTCELPLAKKWQHLKKLAEDQKALAAQLAANEKNRAALQKDLAENDRQRKEQENQYKMHAPETVKQNMLILLKLNILTAIHKYRSAMDSLEFLEKFAHTSRGKQRGYQLVFELSQCHDFDTAVAKLNEFFKKGDWGKKSLNTFITKELSTIPAKESGNGETYHGLLSKNVTPAALQVDAENPINIRLLNAFDHLKSSEDARAAFKKPDFISHVTAIQTNVETTNRPESRILTRGFEETYPVKALGIQTVQVLRDLATRLATPAPIQKGGMALDRETRPRGVRLDSKG